jgi:hypothetical protein
MHKAWIFFIITLSYTFADRVIRKKIRIPLYYAGTKELARLREQENQPNTYKLNRNYEIEFEVEVAPNWYNWYVIE